jgi:NDP-sugar pyrophosphorylase family protein
MSTGGVTGIILAGTYRWSGSSFEKLAPRPLVPIALTPLISYSLGWLRQGGVRRVTICANGTGRAIASAFGDGGDLGPALSYYEDATPRGPAGCVRDAGIRDGADTLIITDGNAIPTVDIRKLLAFHHAAGTAVTAVAHRERSSRAPSPGGLYVFARRALEHIPPRGFQDIKENLIPRLHLAGERVMVHETDGFCPHVLDAPSYLAVSHWMLQHLAQQASDRGPLIHPSACVEGGGRLVGPVQLGARVRVRAGATIVGPTSIGADTTVDRNALVARSVVWDRSEVGPGSVVHGCVIGQDVVIPAGARLFNVVRPEARGVPGSRGISRWPWSRVVGSPMSDLGPAWN